MLNLSFTSRAKKDLKLMEKRGNDANKFWVLIGLLVQQKTLPEHYRDHALTGNYSGSRDCHIEPDWLLIYRVEDRTLYVERTGTHSDLFKK